MSLLSMLKPNGPSGFGYGSTAADVVAGLDLSGQTVLVTGCNSGLGLETMRVLAARGARMIGAARTDEKARAACESIEGETIPVACELSEPRSVRQCVERVAPISGKLDAIICNAGIMALPKLEQKHGYELQFFTNHMGHFILVTGLLDQVADDGRIVVVSSHAHRASPKAGIDFENLSGEKRYSPWEAYGRSKLANILFAKHLARRFDGTQRVANALHPGVIRTQLSRHMNPLVNVGWAIGGPLLLKSVAEGAATQVWAAVHPDAANINGEYLADCNIARPQRRAEDAELAARLWEESERIAAGIAGIE